MPLTDADRAYLSQEWRWLTLEDAGLKAQHPGSREADYGTPCMDATGGNAVLSIVSDMTHGEQRVIVATIAGIPAISFKGRPPMVRLYHERFGGDPVNGKLFMVEARTVDYEAKVTTLTLNAKADA